MKLAGRFGVFAMATMFVGLLPLPAMSAESKTSAHTVVRRADASDPRVFFGRVHLVEGNTHLIDPCWYVRNDIYQRALKDGDLRVRIVLRYMSGGERVRRVLTIAVRDAIAVSDNDAEVAPPSADYTHMYASWDVGTRYIPDAGTTFEHKISLYHAGEEDDDDAET